MKSLTNHATNFILGAAAVAAFGAALIMPGSVNAAPSDEPWPEPPSCSNVTGTCSSMEDIVAYECYFESVTAPWSCDDPFEELMEQSNNKLAAPQGDPNPSPTRLVLPAMRR